MGKSQETIRKISRGRSYVNYLVWHITARKKEHSEFSGITGLRLCRK